MSRPREEQPSVVPGTAQQDGDVLARWGWTEPAVWTERMLTALEEGVKGGKWFRLIDKVFAEGNLLAGYSKVAANQGAPGVDHVTVEAFGNDLEEYRTGQTPSGLRPSLAGSPGQLAESSLLALRTGRSPVVAPHLLS